MAIGLTEEHEALAASVRGFVERHVTAQVMRRAADAGMQPHPEQRPRFWPALAAQGLLGLHLPEEYGGQGYGLVELAVAVEQLGRANTPGPFVPTVLASAVLASALPASALPASAVPASAEPGSAGATGPESAIGELLPGLADGSRTGAVALGPGTAGERAGSGLRVRGTLEPVLGAAAADLLILPVGDGPDRDWVVVDAAEVRIEPLEALDLTRGAARVIIDEVTVPQDRVLAGLGREPHHLAAVIMGAEACGVAGWAVDTAVAYAVTREQFGRPIGQFQGVKHRCARMLIDLERARAIVWDAARADAAADPSGRAYATAVAAATAADAAVACAEGAVQVHGGIGYTWEHDAHRYYRRALTLRALVGRAAVHRQTVAALALDGVRRPMEPDLPDGAEALRAELRAAVAELATMEPPRQRAAMADGGWVTPHLPKPWGRDAGPLEQILIQQELARAKVRPVPLMIAAWVLPSLVQYGTRDQQWRFIPPTLRGEVIWCQLFSEPGAGSDLAGLSTRAERVEGGWLLTGQKIWNSLAREARWGVCLARTDPDAPKHEGITYFLLDMDSPGIDVRPLRECTGEAVFNEVFLDEVFVPDDLVVGPVNAGWRVARNTLANERVGLTRTFQLGADLPRLLSLIRELDLAADPVVRDGLGRLVCDDHAERLLSLRATMKQLSGTDPGATANVRKLVSMEHGQALTEYGFGLLGAEGALTGGRTAGLRRTWTFLLLASRAMTIGGGTTEVNLNVIGERILGLPRDP